MTTQNTNPVYNPDESNLNMLAIFHYILGGLFGLLALLPLIHVSVGALLLSGTINMTDGGEPMPEWVGWLFLGIGIAGVVIGLSVAFLIVLAGRFLAKRKHYYFCMAIGALSCIIMPFGTILGVFTLVILSRESVKAMFDIKPST